MATWRDKLLPASFRGVAFFVDASELSGGRRTVAHEYPFRNDPPYVEDTGRKGKAFPVEAHVLGADYLTARDNLLAALDREGPGELIHPTYGTRRVQVGQVKVRESSLEGGIARVSVEFLETLPGPAEPGSAVSGPDVLRRSATAAVDAVKAQFLVVFDTVTTLRANVEGEIHGVTRSVDAMLSLVDLGAQNVAALKVDIKSANDEAARVAAVPGDLAGIMVDLFQAVADALAGSPMPDPSSVMRQLYAFDPGARPPDTTPQSTAARGNFDATRQLVQRLATVHAATLASTQTYESYDAAVETRAAVLALLDEQCAASADDVYPALQKLRADLVAAVPGDDSDLPRLLTYTPPTTLPSLVLSHRLYGDLSGETDLVTRNRVRYPGFVPGLEPLQVLSHE